MLAACTGVQLQDSVPTGTASHDRYGSWIAASAVGRTLFYAGGDDASYVFDTTGKVVGEIAEKSFGTCSDRNGDVFFTQFEKIVEYAHGATTPTSDYGAPGTVYSCSVDPTTGNLAAVVLCISGCVSEVAIWRSPGDPLQTYTDRKLKSLLYCGYDNNGNLYVDGSNGSRFGLAELPARDRRALKNITVEQNIRFPAQVQWDGRYVAVEKKNSPAIYRVQISGSEGRIVGTVALTGVGARATQSWLHKGEIAVPTGPTTKRAIEIIFWNYPAGGHPTKTFSNFISGGHAMIDGITVSVPPTKPVVPRQLPTFER